MFVFLKSKIPISRLTSNQRQDKLNIINDTNDATNHYHHNINDELNETSCFKKKNQEKIINPDIFKKVRILVVLFEQSFV